MISGARVAKTTLNRPGRDLGPRAQLELGKDVTDMPLPGHLAYLRAAKQLEDELVYRLIERARRDGSPIDTLLSVLLH